MKVLDHSSMPRESSFESSDGIEFGVLGSSHHTGPANDFLTLGLEVEMSSNGEKKSNGCER